MKTLEEILSNTRLDPVTGCRVWLGYVPPSGYGCVRWQGRDCEVHRVVWELVYGDPGALWVLHKCDNRPCCEPMHLFLGTRSDNSQDRVAKGRSVSVFGEQNGNHKLTRVQVGEIRALLAKGCLSQAQIGKRYGITQSAVWCIKHEHTWREEERGDPFVSR